jgi:hypothetical protein
MGHIEGVFSGLRNRPPALIFTGDRTDILRMAIPATFANIDLSAELFRLGVVLGRIIYPFELGETRSDCPRDCL